MNRISACWRIVAIGTTLAAMGCAEKGPFEYIPVHGKVSYEDGTPIPAKGLQLQFKSLDAKPVGNLVPRPGAAMVEADGTFSAATSHKYGDGLVPGKHLVAIQFATDASGKLLIPQDYTSLGSSPLQIDTGDGNIEIKVPKP